MKKPIVVIFDKHVPKRNGGMEVERITFTSTDKKSAMKFIRANAYNYAVVDSVITAQFSDGKEVDIKNRAQRPPDLTGLDNKIISRERLQGYHNFGNFPKKISEDKTLSKIKSKGIKLCLHLFAAGSAWVKPRLCVALQIAV